MRVLYIKNKAHDTRLVSYLLESSIVFTMDTINGSKWVRFEYAEMSRDFILEFACQNNLDWTRGL